MLFGKFILNNIRNPCSLLKIKSKMETLQRVMSRNQIAEELLQSLKSEVNFVFFSLSSQVFLYKFFFRRCLLLKMKKSIKK